MPLQPKRKQSRTDSGTFVIHVKKTVYEHMGRPVKTNLHPARVWKLRGPEAEAIRSPGRVRVPLRRPHLPPVQRDDAGGRRTRGALHLLRLRL